MPPKRRIHFKHQQPQPYTLPPNDTQWEQADTPQPMQIDSDTSQETPPQTIFNVFNLAEMSKPFKDPNYRPPRKAKALRQMLAAERALERPVNEPTFESITAPPSLKPQRKYCDITGLEAKYTEPKTRLRYHSAQIYELIQELPAHRVQEYLSLRKANIVLK